MILGQICIAALYAGIAPIVRVPSKDSYFISRVLDGGALGVIVPHIRSVQDAKDVVAAAKFQPEGHRSSTNNLPHFQYRHLPAKKSNPVVNANTLVIPMVVSPPVDNLLVCRLTSCNRRPSKL